MNCFSSFEVEHNEWWRRQQPRTFAHSCHRIPIIYVQLEHIKKFNISFNFAPSSLFSIYSYSARSGIWCRHTKVSKTLKNGSKWKFITPTNLTLIYVFYLTSNTLPLENKMRQNDEKTFSTFFPCSIQSVESCRIHIHNMLRAEGVCSGSWGIIVRVCKLKNNKNRLPFFNFNNHTTKQPNINTSLYNFSHFFFLRGNVSSELRETRMRIWD